MRKAHLSIIGKLGYLAAYSGVILLGVRLVFAFSDGIDELESVLLFIAFALIIGGVLLLMRDPYANIQRWRLVWVAPWMSDLEKVGFMLITFGVMMLALGLEGNRVIGIASLVVGLTIMLVSPAQA